MTRIDHTNCTHPRTPGGRRACRSGNTPAPVVAPIVPEIKMTGATARKIARHAVAADNAKARVRPSITTPVGRIAVGSVILADGDNGPERYTVLTISDDIKNGYAGWSAEGRWGYVDQVVRVITF